MRSNLSLLSLSHSLLSDRLLAEGPRLSDTVQPPVTQSHSHAMQHGMTTQEAHIVNHVQQPQHEVGTHLQQNGSQIQSGQPVYQPSVQPQHGGVGMSMQHGMGTQVQSGLGAQSSPQVMQQPYQIGIGTQPAVMTGMGVQQNGIGVPPQNGMGAQHQSTVYSSNPGPGRYAPNEVRQREGLGRREREGEERERDRGEREREKRERGIGEREGEKRERGG